MNPALVDVVDALLAACGGTPDPSSGVIYGTGGLAGVRLLDGPPPANLDEADAVAFGLSITQSTAATADARPGWGGQQWETLRVSCLAQSAAGDGPIAPLRARAAALLGEVRTVLAADESLGDVVVRARVGGWSYAAVRAPDAVMAVIEFPIVVDARRFDA